MTDSACTCCGHKKSDTNAALLIRTDCQLIIQTATSTIRSVHRSLAVAWVRAISQFLVCVPSHNSVFIVISSDKPVGGGTAILCA